VAAPAQWGRLRGHYPVRYVEHEDGGSALIWSRYVKKKTHIREFPFLWPRAAPFVPWERRLCRVVTDGRPLSPGRFMSFLSQCIF